MPRTVGPVSQGVATAAPTEPPPEPTATPFVLEMDNCQNCHSDKDMLIDTADPTDRMEAVEISQRFFNFIRVDKLTINGCYHNSGGDGVRPDVVFSKLHCKMLRQ